VAASWSDLTLDGKDYGLDYARMLSHADHLVVWDYFALEARPPAASKDLAARLAAVLPADRWTISLGLWGPGGTTVAPPDMTAAISAALEGGAHRIWITPSNQITESSWDALLRLWLVPMQSLEPAAPR
jgi:hypothetical protein